MEIEEVKQYDPKIGWHIYIKEFSKNDIKKLNILLTKLKMNKNKYLTQKSKKLLKKGFEISLHKRYPRKIKRNFIRIKENITWQIKKLKGPKLIQKILTNENHLLDYDYIPSMKLFSGIWKSKTINGEEFMSIFLSN